jgi:hypothetical protein
MAVWALVAIVAGALSPPVSAQFTASQSRHTSRPLVFEAIRGQADAEVQFVARGAGYTAFLTSTETVLRLGRTPAST